MKRLKLLVMLLISSLNFNIFIKNLKIIVGGTQGVALIVYEYLKITPAILIFIINLLMFILSIILLSKRVVKSIIISTFIYPLFVYLTSYINVILFPKIIGVILAGIISGYTLGNIIKMGYSTGGINVLVLVLKKYYKIPEYISNFIINFIIIISGLIVFGLKTIIYSIIVLTINCLFIKTINNVNHCQTKEVFSA